MRKVEFILGKAERQEREVSFTEGRDSSSSEYWRWITEKGILQKEMEMPQREEALIREAGMLC